MVFDSDGSTTTVFQDKGTIEEFLADITAGYDRIRSENLIINLSAFSRLKVTDITAFSGLSERHRNSGKSFVLVSDQVSYEDLPEELVVVPTLGEAKDIIEMDEIERDLDLQ